MKRTEDIPTSTSHENKVRIFAGLYGAQVISFNASVTSTPPADGKYAIVPDIPMQATGPPSKWTWLSQNYGRTVGYWTDSTAEPIKGALIKIAHVNEVLMNRTTTSTGESWLLDDQDTP